MPVLPKPDYCRPCPLYNASEYGPGQGFSSLEGYGDSGLFVVADSLGQREEEDGLPLRPHGASGRIFQRALDELGIDRQALTVTNLVRCRPPGNELWGQPWTSSAVDHCRHYLSGAVGQRTPRVLLALGDMPLQELSADHSGAISEVRGFVLPSRYGPPLISTYHPSYISRGAWNVYGAFKRDLGYAYHCAVNGVPALLETNYKLHPTDSDIRDFLEWLRSGQLDPFSYDVETAFMLGEKEPDDWKLKKLIQIQFSVRAGHAIVLPWEGAGREVSKVAFASAHNRWSWNGARSDDVVLRAGGIEAAPRERLGDARAGENHDLMLAWAHAQPDFTSKGDDRDGDEKGIPSKLMGLQSAASFYCSEVGPWKHLAHTNLQLYGAYDADYTGRCGRGIFANLEALGLMGGYREHKYELRFTLDEIGEYGLPVDRERQAALRVYTLGELARIQTDLHERVPATILSIHPKAGYKSISGKVAMESSPDTKTPLKDLIAAYDEANPPLVVAAGHVGYLKRRFFPAEVQETIVAESTNIYEAGARAMVGDNRWCIERLYNPHASSPNTKAYIRAMGYPMPTNYNTGADTTGLIELLKLAKETGDPVLQLTYDWRKLRKTGLDYTTGKWVPGPDGRVHPTFRCGSTASGQTTCTEPNCYSKDTEILTRRGWVLFSDLNRCGADQVAQYDAATGAVSFVEPVELFVGLGKLVNITTRQKLDLSVTERHRCPLRHRKTGEVRDFYAVDYPEDWQQIQAGRYENANGKNYSEAQLALICALQADGTVGKGGYLDFTFSRPRKIAKFEWALNGCRIPYTKTEKLSRNSKHADQVRFYIGAKAVPAWLADKKFFGPWVLDLSTESFKELSQEVFFWDGLSTRKNNYSSSDKVNSDWVQVMMALTGRRAKIREYLDPAFPAMRISYQVDISNRDYSLTTNRCLERKDEVEAVYCVAVPTGYVVVRRNGKVAISGNSQQYPEHSELAKRAKEAIRAEPGHIFVKIDMRGFHSRAVGWLANDPLYYQLADEDVHSFITAHYLNLHDAPFLLEMDDDERLSALKAIKTEHGHTRNYKVKRVVHGRQFNMGVNKLYQLHGADFDPPAEKVREAVGDAKWFSWDREKQVAEMNRRGRREARRLFDLFDTLFPRTFVLYLEDVRDKIYHVTPNRLTTPFGHHRFFWGWDMEQAAAFGPSNCAHCHIQSALNRMRRTGDLRRFGCCNFTHDAGWFHCPIELVHECVATVQREFEAPSIILTNSPLGPFQCNSDAEVGFDMANMGDYDKWAAKGEPGVERWEDAFRKEAA